MIRKDYSILCQRESDPLQLNVFAKDQESARLVAYKQLYWRYGLSPQYFSQIIIKKEDHNE